MIKSIINNVVKNSSFAYILQFFKCACRSLKCFKYLHRSWLVEIIYGQIQLSQTAGFWLEGSCQRRAAGASQLTARHTVIKKKNQSYKIPYLISSFNSLYTKFGSQFCNHIYVYIVVVRIIGTLGKYQRRLWKLICIVNPFDLLF